MSLRPTPLDDRLHAYFLTMLPERNPLFLELETEMMNHERGQMSVAPEEGHYLAWLVDQVQGEPS